MIAMSLTLKKIRGHIKFFRKYVKCHDQGHVIKAYVTTRKELFDVRNTHQI